MTLVEEYLMRTVYVQFLDLCGHEFYSENRKTREIDFYRIF